MSTYYIVVHQDNFARTAVKIVPMAAKIWVSHCPQHPPANIIRVHSAPEAQA